LHGVIKYIGVTIAYLFQQSIGLDVHHSGGTKCVWSPSDLKHSADGQDLGACAGDRDLQHFQLNLVYAECIECSIEGVLH